MTPKEQNMANDLDLYPFSTYGGTPIPLDVVAPLYSFTVTPGATALNFSAVVAGSVLSVFSPKALRVATGLTSSLDLTEASLANSFWLPANHIMTFIAAGSYVKCVTLEVAAPTDLLYCTVLKSWQSVGKSNRYDGS